MTNVVSFNGIEEAQKQLQRIPYDLRAKYLESAVKESIREMVRTTTSILAAQKREPLSKTQQERKRLNRSIKDIFRRYENGRVIFAIGGPVKEAVGRHAHLVERGFYHTTGGTYKNSGTRIVRAVRKNRQSEWISVGRGARRAKDPHRTGKGVRGRYIDGRPYIRKTFETHRDMVNAKIVRALQRFADDIAAGNG